MIELAIPTHGYGTEIRANTTSPGAFARFSRKACAERRVRRCRPP